MRNNYLCPACKGQLKIDTCIVFRVENDHNEKGLLLLSPNLGNYEVKRHPDFQYNEGEHISFYCPICQTNLASKMSENLAEIIMIDENNNEYEIYFSEIAGEKCTYKISEGEVITFGKDSVQYMNFFGENPKY